MLATVPQAAGGAVRSRRANSGTLCVWCVTRWLLQYSPCLPDRAYDAMASRQEQSRNGQVSVLGSTPFVVVHVWAFRAAALHDLKEFEKCNAMCAGVQNATTLQLLVLAQLRSHSCSYGTKSH
jgi:hypothetical protein